MLGIDPEQPGACEIGLGMRFTELHVVADDDGVETSLGKTSHHFIGEPAPGHGDEGRRDTGTAKVGEQFAGARAPRHLDLNARHHSIEQHLDDLDRLSVHSTVFTDVRTGIEEIRSDERFCVLMTPRAAMSFDDVVFGIDPIRFGVDDRAVHVPQHRCR